MKSADIKIMAGNVHLEILAKNKSIENEILDFINKEIVRLVNIFNFFDENSALSRLNKYRKIEYSKELDFLIKESIDLFELTKGKFNIFLGAQIRDRKSNKDNSNENLKKFKGIKKFISSDKNNIYFNSKDLIIDLGGIAKGFIVDEIIDLCKKKFKSSLKALLVDARGDIRSFAKGIDFPVGVSDPFDENQLLDIVKLKNGSIITSGHTKQIFKAGSHIVGDRTNVLTVTLYSEKEKCYFLDVLGTYFIQLNSEEILEEVDFNERFKDVECLVVLDNGDFFKSSFWGISTYG